MLQLYLRLYTYWFASGHWLDTKGDLYGLPYVEQAAIVRSGWLETIPSCQEAIDLYFAFNDFDTRFTHQIMLHDYRIVGDDYRQAILKMSDAHIALQNSHDLLDWNRSATTFFAVMFAPLP